MGHSENYESKIIQSKKIETLIKLSEPKRIVRLIDATKMDGNKLINSILKEYLIDDKYSFVFTKAIKDGILLYCKTIDNFEITLNEANIMIRICMNAILKKYNHNYQNNALTLTKPDLVASSIEWNNKQK